MYLITVNMAIVAESLADATRLVAEAVDELNRPMPVGFGMGKAHMALNRKRDGAELAAHGFNYLGTVEFKAATNRADHACQYVERAMADHIKRDRVKLLDMSVARQGGGR